MPIEFECPGCRNRLRVPDEHAGKQARCPECSFVSQVPYLAVDGQPQLTEPPLAPPPRFDYAAPGSETPNPYASPTTPASGLTTYTRPHRGALLLILGIVSILCCNLLGIAPWVMANSDLAAMDRGEIDPSGRGLTQAGRVLGIIAIVLMVLALVAQFVMVAVHG